MVSSVSMGRPLESKCFLNSDDKKYEVASFLNFGFATTKSLRLLIIIFLYNDFANFYLRSWMFSIDVVKKMHLLHLPVVHIYSTLHAV